VKELQQKARIVFKVDYALNEGKNKTPSAKPLYDFNKMSLYEGPNR